MTKFPPIPVELLEALETRIPHRCPDISTPERAIWFDSGRRAVVDWLRAEFERQQKDILKGQA
jgi:hypothetical protein